MYYKHLLYLLRGENDHLPQLLRSAYINLTKNVFKKYVIYVYDSNVLLKCYWCTLISTLSSPGVMFLPVFVMKASGQ
jgi:hypothetical protein